MVCVFQAIFLVHFHNQIYEYAVLIDTFFYSIETINYIFCLILTVFIMCFTVMQYWKTFFKKMYVCLQLQIL